MNHAPEKSVEHAIAEDVSLPLWSEGWFVAGIVFGVSLGAVFYVLIGSVYFSGSSQPNPTNTFTVFVIALLLAAALCGIGLLCHARYAAAMHNSNPAERRANLHGLVATQRLIVVCLLLFFGAAAIWQAFAQATGLGVLSLALVVGQLIIGQRLLPRFLNVLAGRAARTNAALRGVDVLAAFGIGALGVVAGAPVVMNAMPGSFFLLITQVLSALAIPWVPVMLTVAGIHRRASHSISL